MHTLSGKQLHQLFLQGDKSAEQIATYFLNRIAAFDPAVNSFLAVCKDHVLESARALDEKKRLGKRLGKLAGIPIAIKDNIHIKGMITTCASKFLENYVAPYSATVIKRIEQEDGIFIGKTNLDEFAMGSSNENSAYKLCYNPWNLAHSPGGSSGGSAASVAARLAPISLGSDTGGSIRQPAAFCGILGFKPTYGRVSRYGLVAYGSSLDQIGPFAHTSEDIALMMEVLGGSCPNDPTTIQESPLPYIDRLEESIQGKTIGVPWHFLETLSPELKENFQMALTSFEQMGVRIIDVDLDLCRYSTAVYYIIAPAEASTNLARFDGIRYGKRSKAAESIDTIYDYSKLEGYGTEVKKRILLGTFVLSSGYCDAYYKKAMKVRTLILQQYQKAFEKCDIIAMPTAPTPSFAIGAIKDPLKMYFQDLYTLSANLAGIPAISVPSGLSKDDLPLSIQLQGPQQEDQRVVRFAHHFCKKNPFAARIPPLFDKEATL